MIVNVRSQILKQILLGDEDAYKDYMHQAIPLNKNSFNIVFADNKIILKGDFKLIDDIIFESNEVYDKEIIFDGGNYKNIIFRGGTFKKIFFRRGNYDGYVSIRGGSIDSLILLGGQFNHWLGTIDGLYNKEDEDSMLAEDPLNINRFEIEGGTYVNSIWISGGDINSLEVKSITPIQLHCKPNDDKIFDSEKNEYFNKFTSKPRIKNLLISRYSNKNTFYHFSELDLKNLKFENFTNLGNITISKVSLYNTISFENSDLGKTSFIDCDFSNNQMLFDSSRINEIALAGAKLPNPNNIDNLTPSNKFQKQLALSQIKKVYQNLGDNLTARNYKAEELNTYKTTLNFGWEKFNLWLNKHTNNHGQRWDRPLALLLLSTVFFYTLYCLSLGFEIVSPFETDWIVFRKNASYFLEYLNPIRKNDFIPKALLGAEKIKTIPNTAILIDSISKIVNAYLLYQFIAAFRKFGK